MPILGQSCDSQLCPQGQYCSIGEATPSCIVGACSVKADDCKGWFSCKQTSETDPDGGTCKVDPEKVIKYEIKKEIKLISDKINSIEDKLKHNPCANQHNFSRAFSKAYDSKEKSMNKITTPVIVYLFIHLIFLVWGIMLAFKQPLETRNVHITLALVFSPAYVLAHYLSLLE